MRDRIADKQVLPLVKAFLKSGIMSRDGTLADTRTGTPQGGILSPLLANFALTVLDEYVTNRPGGPTTTEARRAGHRRRGEPNLRLVRYADDFLILVSGTREHCEALREKLAAVLAPMGMRLSMEKTRITTSTRASIFSDGASGVTGRRALIGRTSTPIRPGIRCVP
ncbi:reverse transcriptase/maturase family protein [Kitasatospora sp. NPDC058115]|uniref:reverse transcriptase/maturase family protein n=1 Tax=Kitasatospora sp. NPDC058115 TaxID=3346347 RepID=UPI0036DF79FD